MSDNKLDRIEASLSRIDQTLAVQAEQLREHMRRTAALEQKIQPLEEWRSRFAGALTFLTILAILSSIVEIFLKLRK